MWVFMHWDIIHHIKEQGTQTDGENLVLHELC